MKKYLALAVLTAIPTMVTVLASPSCNSSHSNLDGGAGTGGTAGGAGSASGGAPGLGGTGSGGSGAGGMNIDAGGPDGSTDARPEGGMAMGTGGAGGRGGTGSGGVGGTGGTGTGGAGGTFGCGSALCVLGVSYCFSPVHAGGGVGGFQADAGPPVDDQYCVPFPTRCAGTTLTCDCLCQSVCEGSDCFCPPSSPPQTLGCLDS